MEDELPATSEDSKHEMSLGNVNKNTRPSKDFHNSFTRIKKKSPLNEANTPIVHEPLVTNDSHNSNSGIKKLHLGTGFSPRQEHLFAKIRDLQKFNSEIDIRSDTAPNEDKDSSLLRDDDAQDDPLVFDMVSQGELICCFCLLT